FRSSLNALRSSSVAKYLCARPHSVMVFTTRPISCLTLRSRSGEPSWPRKYFETTMFVACWDQNFGISTSRCSSTTSPPWAPMTAERNSHTTSSNGSTPASVKNRGNARPGAAAFFARFSASPATGGIGTCEPPLLSTDCWPAPAALRAARSFIRPHLLLLGLYPGSDENSPPQGASSNFVDGLARREIESRAYSARQSAWKLGGFPLIAWSRNGEQICAPLHRLSTAIHQILWLSFRAN